MNYRKFFLAWYLLIALFIFGAAYHVDWEEPPPIPNGLPQAAWQYNGFRALPAAAFWPVWLSVKMWAKIIPPRDQNKCGTALYLT